MSTKGPASNGRDQYPERDTVEDVDPDPAERPPARPAREERRNEERGNRGPDEQPGYGQGA